MFRPPLAASINAVGLHFIDLHVIQADKIDSFRTCDFSLRADVAIDTKADINNPDAVQHVHESSFLWCFNENHMFQRD